MSFAGYGHKPFGAVSASAGGVVGGGAVGPTAAQGRQRRTLVPFPHAASRIEHRAVPPRSQRSQVD